MESEVQSVEVSYFLHATEDEGRVTAAVRDLIATDAEPERQELEGHHGNKIVWLRFHLVGAAAWDAFKRLMLRMGSDGRSELLRDLETLLDEHKALYIRLNRQFLMEGRVVRSTTDPVRVKIKPRSYRIGGEPSGFYARLVESVR